MLAKSEKSSTCACPAKTALRAAIGNPLLVRRCAGVAAAVVGLILMTVAWDGPADLVSRPQVAAPKRTSWESDRSIRSRHPNLSTLCIQCIGFAADRRRRTPALEPAGDRLDL